ncbi:tyrosine-protein phosphatase [Paenarthrobacter sp. NCHU4564]|uniref:tyrosine-protein phosphatase n=1 Tax=Paenarthrobacter sp. NCHU4564 TaxID=3451353 RepID=UPI003F9C7C3F
MSHRSTQVSKPVRVEGAYNVRSFGPSPWLLRSAAIDDLTPAGETTLAQLNVAKILDLREDNEQTSSGNHRFDVERLPLYRSPDGPPQLGSLEGVYAMLLTNRGTELARAVAALADAPGPVLIHCTAGKDRTGLVVALALSAGGWSREAIVADYVRSASEVRPHRQDTVRGILRDFDLDEAGYRTALRLHLDSPPEAIEYALDKVAENGGARNYLLAHGLTEEQLDHLRSKASS